MTPDQLRAWLEERHPDVAAAVWAGHAVALEAAVLIGGEAGLRITADQYAAEARAAARGATDEEPDAPDMWGRP